MTATQRVKDAIPKSTSVRHEFRPRGAARELLGCRAKQVLISGPAGTGKSRAALEKINLLMLSNPGAKGLILRKTLRSLASSGLRTWEEKVVPEAIASKVVSYFGGSAREAAQYRYSNGSVVVIGGMDDPDKIMSTEYDVIYIQEAIDLTEDDWEKATSRLRNGKISFQQLIADCNPTYPHHWLNQRCLRGDTLMLFSKHTDNPVYYTDQGVITDEGDAYINGILAKLTGHRRARLYEGRWASAEGLVYEGYDPSVHVVDGMPVGWENWTRRWSVDFGYRNPFVCQFWAEDSDGGLWLYREIYRTGVLVEDVARQVMNMVRRPRRDLGRAPNIERDADWEWLEPRPRAVVCDHDMEDRATLERHIGLSTVAAEKAVKTGIEACQLRFRLDERGRTRMHFLRSALVERDTELVKVGKPSSTLEELAGYCWPDGVKQERRENPVKEHDHGMDAMRYLVMEADFGRAPRIRFI